MKQKYQMPAHLKLRGWQKRALRRLAALMKNFALIVATPGSGKTLLGLLYALQLLIEGEIDFVVVVVPGDSLREHWAKRAARVGLDLDPHFSNADGVVAPDYVGAVVTYAQVASQPDLFRALCGGRRVLVLPDEVHHVGDELSWGRALRQAFELASYILSMSGTPFRSDNNAIPFVDYNEGRSCADFEYGYVDALADGVCRPVYFPCFEGTVEWVSRYGRLQERTLGERLGRALAAERLNTILDPAGEWLRTVIANAHRKLQEMRAEGHADAGGLIVCKDQFNARRVAQLVRDACGVEPVLVISDDADAGEQLKRFADGAQEWLVSVRMVSEGCDFPRLRVGVYASNVVTELYFRQFVGRFVRVIDGLEEQSAAVYIPAVEPIVSHARKIKEERDHVLNQQLEQSLVEDATGGDDEAAECDGSRFMPLSSDATDCNIVFDGDLFNEAEIAHATTVALEMGVHLPAAQVAALLRVGAAQAGTFILHDANTAPAALATEQPTASKHDRKQSLRQVINRLANQLAYATAVTSREVHAQWIAQGGMPQATATEDDLRAKRDWLIQSTREVRSRG